MSSRRCSAARRASPGRAACPRRARPWAASSAATSSASDLSLLGRLAPLLDLLLDASRGRLGPARSRRCRRCSSGSDGPGTSSSSKARSTNTMASTSRMWARNRLPRPSPLLAPLDQAADVDELHGGRHDVLAGRHRGQRVEALVGHLGHARRWGRWWRRRRARPARRRRPARCTARTCPRWGGRRTRIVPWRRPYRPPALDASRRRYRARCRRWPPPTPSTGSPTSSTAAWPRAAGCAAFRKAAEHRARAGRRRGRPAPRRGHRCTELPGIGDSTGGRSPSGARRRASPEYLAELEDARPTLPARRRRRPAGRAQGRLPQPTRPGPTAGRRIRDDGPHRHGPRPRVPGAHRPLPPPHHRPRPQPRAAAGSSSTRSTALNEELAPFRILTGMEVDILEDGALDQDDDLLDRLDVVVASVHSKLSMPGAGDDPPHGDGRRQPPRRHPRPLHRPQGRSAASRAAVRRSTPTSCSPPAPSSTPRSRSTAGPSARTRPTSCSTWPSSGTARSAIDTDAHAPGQLEWQPYGCDKAARHGIEPDASSTRWAADDLLAWTATHNTA